MHIEEKYNRKKIVIEIVGTIVGAFVMAIGISLFLLPNQLSSGGISGVATITYYLLNIPMGTMILVINIPLFLIAIYKIGKSFFLKSLIGTVSLSLFIDWLDQLEPLTKDRFLACIYGGIIIGLRNSYYLKS
ncbi:MAG: YitT family protein [Clostridia bacterium]|nr:YitT family protein [Clostridia bacterium]